MNKSLYLPGIFGDYISRFNQSHEFKAGSISRISTITPTNRAAQTRPTYNIYQPQATIHCNPKSWKVEYTKPADTPDGIPTVQFRMPHSVPLVSVETSHADLTRKQFVVQCTAILQVKY